jgi:hypothetical protein
MRDEGGRHVVLLSARQHHNWVRHGAAKYAKFAYSTHFGFSVPAGSWGLEQGAFDSTLALSEDGAHWRPREVPESPSASDGVLHTHWTPWPDVEVETWLLALAPWHVRVHRVRSGRALHTAEGAFAVDRDPEPHRTRSGPGHARIDSPAGLCVIEDLRGGRTGDLVRASPGTNVLARRTVIPTLVGDLAPGDHLLACAVLGSAGSPEPSDSAPSGGPGSPEPAGLGAWPAPPAWETVVALLRAFHERGHPGLPEDD